MIIQNGCSRHLCLLSSFEGDSQLSLIPAEVIDRVRTSVNILDVVGQSVQMHKSGKNWFGLCPFHPEKTPSFSVNEEKQIFTCFSCHRGKCLQVFNGTKRGYLSWSG